MNTYFLPVFYTILQLLILMGLGFALRRFWRWEDSFFKNISSFLVRIILPIYLFVRISRGSVEDLKEAWIFPLASFLIIGIGVLFGFIVFRFFSQSQRDRKASIALAGFGNSGFIPLSMIEFFPLTLPIVGEIFGISSPLLFVGGYLVVQSAMLWSLGNYLILGKEQRIKLKDIISPPLYGICLGIIFVLFVPEAVLFDKKLPFSHIYGALDKLSNIVLPLALISLGSMIGGLRIKDLQLGTALKIAGGVAAVRFLLMPLFFFGSYFLLLRKIGLSQAQLWVLFLESHVPPALNLSVMVNHSGINRENTAFTMLFTYLLYILLFPFLVVLFFSLPGIEI